MSSKMYIQVVPARKINRGLLLESSEAAMGSQWASAARRTVFHMRRAFSLFQQGAVWR